MFLTFKWSLFFSWSIFDASQLPAYAACFRLPKKHSTGRSWGTFSGSEVFKPSRLLCSWRSFEHLLPLFQDWGGYMRLLPLAEGHAFLPEGLSVGNSWNTTCSWDLNQASCSWPPSGDLTRHLRACAGGLGQIVPDPAFLFVVFLSSNDWRKWVNSAFRKTPLFKNCRSERLSLLFISKIEIYNPLSALLLTLVCHFYHVLLRVAIFCTQCCYSYKLLKETKRFVHKNSVMENLPVQSCPIFYHTTLTHGSCVLSVSSTPPCFIMVSARYALCYILVTPMPMHTTYPALCIW